MGHDDNKSVRFLKEVIFVDFYYRLHNTGLQLHGLLLLQQISKTQQEYLGLLVM